MKLTTEQQNAKATADLAEAFKKGIKSLGSP